jgi:hypothetical protein
MSEEERTGQGSETFRDSFERIDSSAETNPSATNTPDNQNMEVHHHPQVEKKSLKEYLLEGLMIFLAVTMGFFAESYREHISERSKEKEYIASLNEDLKTDTLNLSTAILGLQDKILQLDSLMVLLNNNNNNSAQINDMYFYARWATRKKAFQSTDRTFRELSNSGSFRLLTNSKVTESIVEYEQEVNYYNSNRNNDLQERQLLYPFISKIFDANVFQTMVNNDDGIIERPAGNHTLKSTDKDYINQFIYYLHQVKSTFIVEKKTLYNLKDEATSIIELINKDE